jgi:dynein heavy chain
VHAYVVIAGTFIIGGCDEIQATMDDQIVKIQAMNSSPFIKPFKDRATTWETMLQTLQVSVHMLGV